MDWIEDVNWLMFWTGWAIFVGVVLLVARGFYRAGYRDAMNEVERFLDSRKSTKDNDVTFERVVVSHEPVDDTEWCDKTEYCVYPLGHEGQCTPPPHPVIR